MTNEQAIERLKAYCRMTAIRYVLHDLPEVAETAIVALRATTIEAAPLVRGGWEYKMVQEPPDVGDEWHESPYPSCTNCDYVCISGESQFCPNCGAKMTD